MWRKRSRITWYKEGDRNAILVILMLRTLVITKEIVLRVRESILYRRSYQLGQY